MNRSARPAYKHKLLYLPPFDLTDRLETREQTCVLLLSDCYRFFLIVDSRILRSFEFDGKEFFVYRVQSNSVQSAPPESFLILSSDTGDSSCASFHVESHERRDVLIRDFHFLRLRCFPQFVLRAKLHTLFLVPKCTQPALRLNREKLNVPVCFPMRINFLQQLSDTRMCAAVTTSFCPRHPAL